MAWDLRAALERVAAQSTTRPPAHTGNVVEFTDLNKLNKAIRELQSKQIHVDGEEHKLLLEFQDIESKYQARLEEINADREKIGEDLLRLQTQMAEAVKSCGIHATVIVKPRDGQP